MHIALDASRTTVAQRTGTEAYALHLLSALLALDSPHRWRLYFRDSPPPELFSPGPNRTLVTLPQRRLWTHLGLGPALTRDGVDGVFVPAHVLPFRNRTPSVMTVHDLGYLYHPEAHTRLQRWYLDQSTRYAVRHARHLLADSQATRADLIRHYQADPARITVVYPALPGEFSPVRHPARRAPVLAKYDLTTRYFLYVGTIQPRKNLIRLIDAFATLPNDGVLLALAGRPGWLSEPILQHIQARGLGNRVRSLGYVPDEDLPALYSSALAFVFPSLYEGFGFPVLEAMACGAPVIASTAGSLPEVAGEAALLFDPTDSDTLAAHLHEITVNTPLRQTLMMRGFQQAHRFSWQIAAQQTLTVLEQAFAPQPTQ